MRSSLAFVFLLFTLPILLPAARLFPADAFGDPFELARLPLPRPAAGYAVQRLGSDCLLDGEGRWRPVRDAGQGAIFPDFSTAHASASAWCLKVGQCPQAAALAIVPVGYDNTLARPILIYGVLPAEP